MQKEKMISNTYRKDNGQVMVYYIQRMQRAIIVILILFLIIWLLYTTVRRAAAAMMGTHGVWTARTLLVTDMGIGLP